ncbi:MAG: class I SAM-dependent methyltransferase [Planctomycetota bacterium]
MNIQERLEEAWFAASGADPATVRTIHPGDELLLWEQRLGRPSDELRATYMRSGHDTLRYVEDALRQAGRPLGKSRRVLEFASGFGRVTRHLVRVVDPKHVWTSEILEGADKFSAANFGVHGVGSAAAPEELPLEGEFDLIFVVSLFSHLPQTTFARFLGALYERLSDDGVLLFSTHGPAVVPDVALDARGFGYDTGSESLALSGDEYGTTAVTIPRVGEFAEAVGVRHLASLERGLWGFQDLFAASKQPLPGLDAWKHAPIPRGSIERCHFEGGNVEIGGWVRLPADAGSIARTTLVMDDGARRVDAELVPYERPLVEAEGGAAMRQTDWFVAGPLGEAAPGKHSVAAVVETTEGARGCIGVVPLDVD